MPKIPRPAIKQEEIKLRAVAMGLAIRMAPLIRPQGQIKDKDLISDANAIIKWLKGETS